MTPELADRMLDVIVSANLGPMPQDFTDKVLSLCAANEPKHDHRCSGRADGLLR